MPRTLKIRIQAREFRGVVSRGWGFGRAMSYGPWVTRYTFDDLDAAEAQYDHVSRTGLYKWRMVRGSQILRKDV